MQRSNVPFSVPAIAFSAPSSPAYPWTNAHRPLFLFRHFCRSLSRSTSSSSLLDASEPYPQTRDAFASVALSAGWSNRAARSEPAASRSGPRTPAVAAKDVSTAPASRAVDAITSSKDDDHVSLAEERLPDSETRSRGGLQGQRGVFESRGEKAAPPSTPPTAAAAAGRPSSSSYSRPQPAATPTTTGIGAAAATADLAVVVPERFVVHKSGLWCSSSALPAASLDEHVLRSSKTPARRGNFSGADEPLDGVETPADGRGEGGGVINDGGGFILLGPREEGASAPRADGVRRDSDRVDAGRAGVTSPDLHASRRSVKAVESAVVACVSRSEPGQESVRTPSLTVAVLEGAVRGDEGSVGAGAKCKRAKLSNGANTGDTGDTQPPSWDDSGSRMGESLVVRGEGVEQAPVKTLRSSAGGASVEEFLRGVGAGYGVGDASNLSPVVRTASAPSASGGGPAVTPPTAAGSVPSDGGRNGEAKEEEVVLIARRTTIGKPFRATSTGVFSDRSREEEEEVEKTTTTTTTTRNVGGDSSPGPARRVGGAVVENTRLDAASDASHRRASTTKLGAPTSSGKGKDRRREGGGRQAEESDGFPIDSDEEAFLMGRVAGTDLHRPLGPVRRSDEAQLPSISR